MEYLEQHSIPQNQYDVYRLGPLEAIGENDVLIPNQFYVMYESEINIKFQENYRK